MSKKEDELKLNFLQRYKKDMHQEFFYQDSSLESIKVPIFSGKKSQKHITPFRSTTCINPDCVYDLDELISIFVDPKYSASGVKCSFCKATVQMSSFYLDHTLKGIIDHIWAKNNNIGSFIKFRHITVTRDGKWEPDFSEYMSRLIDSLCI